MNIGIITFHRGFNYGASLQCYSLKKVLETCGHTVTVINYLSADETEPGLPVILDWELKECFKHLNVRSGVKYFLRQIRIRKNAVKMRKSFYGFDKNLNLSKMVRSASEINKMAFDAIVLGSDQIWTDDLPYDGVYWGEGLLGNVISYAASGIKSESQDLHTGVLKKYVNHVSVREKSAQALLKQSGINAECTLDPVLLLGKNEIDKLSTKAKIDGDYVFCYALGGDEHTLKYAKQISKEKNIKYVWMNGLDGVIRCEDGSEIACDGPGGFVSIISSATYVVTNSFHGTALSLLYHIPFYAVLYKNKSRIFDLLQQFGMEERITDPADDPASYQIGDINWVNFDNTLSELQGQSKRYLQYALHGR